MEPHRRRTVGPAVWRADEIGGKEGLARALDERELSAFEALLAATRETPLLATGREQFADPSLDELGRACGHEVAQGRGAMVLTGLDPAR